MREIASKLVVAVTLSILMLVSSVAPAFARFSGSVIVCQIVDTDVDGFKDLLFHVTDQIGGVPGVEIKLKTCSGNILLTSTTNGTGYCIFNNMPSGNYSWEASDGSPNNTGFSYVSLEQHGSLSEKEAIVIQFLLLTWMGNSTEKTKTFYENFSRYVGYDLSTHPFPSSAGKNLSTFSTQLFQWYQGLDDCIVNNITDSDVSQILEKIIGVSREVCLRTLESSFDLNSPSNYTDVRMSLKGQAANTSLINYTLTFSDGNSTIENTILQVPTSNAKTIAALSGIFVSSLDAFVEMPQFEDSVWTFEAQSNDLLVRVYDFLDMSKNIYDSLLFQAFLDFAKSLSSEVNTFSLVLGEAMTAVSGFMLGLMCYLELIYRFDGIGNVLAALQHGNLGAIALTIGMAAGFAFTIACVALIALGIGTSAIPVIGPLIGVIIAIVEVFMERDDYRSWLDSVGCAVGTSLSQIMQVRQTLKAINTTQMMLSGTVYEQAAGLLHRFSYSSNAGNFSDYSATLESYGQKEQRLAEAIDDAIPALDNLVKDFLYWNGPSGTVIGHIEGYESTFANWTDSYNSVSLIYPAGMSYSSTYLFKRVDAWNLDPSPSLKVFADYDGWTNHPSRLTDSDGNQFSVTYDNNTDVFNYHPQLGFSSGLTRYVKDDSGNLDVFYQYKFFFDSGTTTYHIWESLPRWKLPRQDVLSEWQNYLKAEYEQQVLPRIQNVSSLVDQLSADNNPPQTSLSVSNIRTDLIAWIDLYYGKIHVRPQSVFQLTSSDNSSGVDITSYRIFNQTYESGWITLACSNNNPVTFAMPLGLGNGQYKIEYNSTDCVGNVEAPKQFVGVPQTGWLFNTTIQSPTYVFERADLDVSPKVLDAEVHAGSSLALNFTIYEVTGFDAVHNVSLHASILASVDNKTVSSDQWNFPVNYFAVSALGQTNVTVILDLPTNQSKGNYTGVIEATYDGKMQEVLVNITVLSRGDINNDGAVDIYDAIILAHAFNSHPGASEWNPSADINNDGVVDIYDAIILAGNFEH